MWYVIQVLSGQEGKACELINSQIAGERSQDGKPVLKECFVPRYQVERKFHGQYRTLTRNLFPGYVIAVTSRVGELNERLGRIPTFTRMLGSEKSFIPLDRTEKALINAFTTEKHRVVSLSKAVIVGDDVVVTEGPMIGREGWITEVNRRKGTARIETDMFGRTINVEIGLAVVGRRPEKE
ncbi:antiterminator LoaP [Arabiibacter massiliensis]|uniref:antiterminator LoaP n=1 Tax=Arabiibacter massiliensis TaxID=1870985 RepID=UPI0009BAB670|nr:antiterminator LoaP [Arabiibacter massiliensis]